MSQTMQTIYQLFVFVLLISLSMCRPSGSDSEESPENQLVQSTSDLENRYVPAALQYYQPQFVNYDGINPLDQLQLQQLQYRAFYPNNLQFRGGAFMPLPAGLRSSYRPIVAKRQTRYRQCYFNPISCFRK